MPGHPNLPPAFLHIPVRTHARTPPPLLLVLDDWLAENDLYELPPERTIIPLSRAHKGKRKAPRARRIEKELFSVTPSPTLSSSPSQRSDALACIDLCSRGEMSGNNCSGSLNELSACRKATRNERRRAADGGFYLRFEGILYRCGHFGIV